MGNRDTYTYELKPSEDAIQKSYNDYLELKELLEKSKYHSGGFYFLNNNKIFNEENKPKFCNYQIKLETSSGINCFIRRIEVRLSKDYKIEETLTNDISKSQSQNEDKNRGKYLNWSKKPKMYMGDKQIQLQKLVIKKILLTGDT